jgi:hypothetical protein
VPDDAPDRRADEPIDIPVEPPDRTALGSFPSRTLAAATRMYRIHHADLGPSWFGSATARGGGRFDLAAPNGSSYWALRREAAFLETVVRRPVTMIPLELLDRFQLTTTPLPAELVAANLPVKRARSFGLTAEIHTTTNVNVTRPWAEALHAAGFDAMIAIPRHDVTAKLRSVTLFGRAGEHPPFDWIWAFDTGPLPTKLIDSMAAWGIRCLPIPFDAPTITPGD